MKTEKEIIEEIECLKGMRDIYVVQTSEWRKFNHAAIKLEWVLAK